MSTERCPQCDEPVMAGARYCRECGAEIEDSPEMTPGRRDIETGEWAAETVESGKLLAALAHLLALFTWLLGPLVIMLVSDNPFVVQNAKNAVMWQLMFTIYSIIAAILILIVVGFFILMALMLVDIVFIVIATVKASEGEAWQYPLTPEI